MSTRLERLVKEYHLNEFYTYVIENTPEEMPPDQLDTVVKLAPFIKKFSSTYITYYDLRNLPPLAKETEYTSRLTEFYAQLAARAFSGSADQIVEWVLNQEFSPNKPFFPSRPVPRNYQALTRGINLLIELVKSVSPLGSKLRVKLTAYVEGILNPKTDTAFETRSKQVLDLLLGFNARKEGVESEAFQALTKEIEILNSSIDTNLLGNNTFVSLTQQITEINRALKSIFISDFDSVFLNKKADQSKFWKGLKNIGFSGGQKILSGSFPELRINVERWLDKEFPEQKSEIIQELQNASKRPELPTVTKEQMPEAIQLFALNLLGVIGLKDSDAIRLALTFCSRFINKTIRDGALQNIRKNEQDVKTFFYIGLNKESDYQQQLNIANQHDAIFSQISAISLLPMYGKSYVNVLTELDTVIGPNGFWLNDFIKSAFLIQKEAKPESSPERLRKDRLISFQNLTRSLNEFKAFIESTEPNVFEKLLNLWGISYVVSWSLADYEKEKRLFRFIAEAASKDPTIGPVSKDHVFPLNGIIALLTEEPDAKQLIEKLLTYLLNSKISFDFPLFQSLFRVVAQRDAQLQAGIIIRDGFSEQRGYSVSSPLNQNEHRPMDLLDPHIFHPIVIFLITVLNMKKISIPKDAFIETDISLYLNSLAGVRNSTELGYQTYLAHKLISSIPYIVDFSSHHEGIIRKTIADLDESYQRKNTLIHYIRIKIHRAPSKLDLDFCLAILNGLASLDLDDLLQDLIQLMKGVGDEAIPDLQSYFVNFNNKLTTLGKHLKVFKNLYPTVSWHQIAEDRFFKQTVLDLPGIDEESIRDILALVTLANALSNYWTQRVNQDLERTVFTEAEIAEFEDSGTAERLDMIRVKRAEYQAEIGRFDQNLEPYQHIFLKRHVIQSDWNFDFFGFWPYYSEKKFEIYNLDRKLALLERDYLEKLERELKDRLFELEEITEDNLIELRTKCDSLVQMMTYQVDEGLTPSKFFLDTVDILKHDQLTISQLQDILGILYYRELAHVDAFIAESFGRFPERITRALGRENLDFDLGNLSQEDDMLLYPLVQETVLGNIMASARPISLMEEKLSDMLRLTTEFSRLGGSVPVFIDRPPRPASPVYAGYKSYALVTLAKDGFNVPSFETFPTSYFKERPHVVEKGSTSELRNDIISLILNLERASEKRFGFNRAKLTQAQCDQIDQSRGTYDFDISQAPGLLVSARSGSYRSMPGILGTVLNIGYSDTFITDSGSSEKNSFRSFLSSFGSVVCNIKGSDFARIIKTSQAEAGDGARYSIDDVIQRFKGLIEDRYQPLSSEIGIDLDWSDPLSLLTISILSVWRSWDTEEAINLRRFLGISDDWKTAVIIMEMKMADKNPQSFSAILFSGDPQGKVNAPHGDILFGRPGEDIASGLASEGTPLESLETRRPELYRQIVDLLEQIKINKGNIDVDVEMVGEYDEVSGETELFVIQERQMPRGVKVESEDFVLEPTQTPPIVTGLGVNGGVQTGVFLDGVGHDYYQLRKMAAETRLKIGSKDQYHGPGIFLLMEYVTPAEALKMNIPDIDGIVTTKIGKSSHASISAKRDGKLFICEARIQRKNDIWLINGKPIQLGNDASPDLYTLVAYPKSISPYSGNIYEGKMRMRAKGT